MTEKEELRKKAKEEEEMIKHCGKIARKILKISNEEKKKEINDEER